MDKDTDLTRRDFLTALQLLF